jgi:hypothetical protein
MGRRRYDRQRILANELRRLRLARNRRWIIGPYYDSELGAQLDIPMGCPRNIEAAVIVTDRWIRRERLYAAGQN